MNTWAIFGDDNGRKNDDCLNRTTGADKHRPTSSVVQKTSRGITYVELKNCARCGKVNLGYSSVGNSSSKLSK